MTTRISPMLAVSDSAAAIEFYKRAFGPEELWRIGEAGEVAGLSIDGAQVFLAQQNPPRTRSPDDAGHTTVRIELFVDDPEAVQKRAIAAGAREGNPVVEHTHATFGPRSTLRMLQGGVIDPFGHVWLIGKFLDQSEACWLCGERRQEAAASGIAGPRRRLCADRARWMFR